MTHPEFEFQCVHHLFEQQVDRAPSAIALIDGSSELTFRQTDDRANQLARLLKRYGTGTGARVGVYFERSNEMVIALLAIMKAGASYVPLDPRSPHAHVARIIEDAGISTVVASETLTDQASRFAERVLTFTNSAEMPRDRLTLIQRSTSPMYVLYTSGSTGTPKGVETSHRPILSRLRWAAKTFPYSRGEVACSRTALGFVDSVAEIFAPLVLGVPLFVVSERANKDTSLMIEQFAAQSVSRVVMVPSLLSTILDDCTDLAVRVPKLIHWFLGGEPVPVPLVQQFQRMLPGRKLINIYGATEVSGDATYFDFDFMPKGLQTSPIGTPLSDVYVRIVDSDLREAGDGELGEVVVSGICLANGYLGQPALTAERFVANPFPEGGTLYKMGDIGRRLPSGDLQYVGRQGDQVKVRGIRVELGAVEAAIAAISGVTQAVVIAREAEGQAMLVAFYAGPIASVLLRAQLSEAVPESMVPTHCIPMRDFPMTPNGKIDRAALRALPLYAGPEGGPPATKDEQRVARIFEQLLDCKNLGRTQNFHDLGGNSLLAMRITVRLRTEFDVAVNVSAIYQHPTIAELTAHLTAAPAAPLGRRHRSAAIGSSGRVPPRELPLSYFQFPFWLFYALNAEISLVTEVFGIARDTDIERLQQAFSRTVQSSDTLWMRYSRWRPVQRSQRHVHCGFRVRDQRIRPDVDRVLAQEAAENRAMPFDLSRPPHIHARLVRTATGDHLLLAVPHIAVDLSGLEEFRLRLTQHYDGLVRRDPSPTLADCIAWERDPARRLEVLTDQSYWQSLAPPESSNAFPARMAAPRGTTSFASCRLSEPMMRNLAAYCQKRKVTMPSVLVSAVHATLHHTAGLTAVSTLLILDKRSQLTSGGLFSTMAAAMRVHTVETRMSALVEKVATQLMASYEHSDHLARHPTMFNNFWKDAPASARWAARKLSALGSALWPAAKLDPDVLAEYLFALVPYSSLFPGKHASEQQTFVAVNVMPEVAQAATGSDPQTRRFCRARNYSLLVNPIDLVPYQNAFTDHLLQINFSRDIAGVSVNLHGGALDQKALTEIAGGIVTTLENEVTIS
jgi:amino acid adenylation domain-containing protein